MGIARDELTYSSYRGREIDSVTDDLAALRIAVFRDFPYLYEGSIAYEKNYLKTYTTNESAYVFVVHHQDKVVGATTCIALKEETDEVQAPFLRAQMNISSIFYFGESILLQAYRGLGIGHRFFKEREEFAQAYGGITTVCFCAVDREKDHPLRPLDYRPLDDFWISKGYTKSEHLSSYFEWKDVNESAASAKRMEYWLKSI